MLNMAQQSSQYPSAADGTNNLDISNSPDMSTGDNIVSIDTGFEDDREKILKWLSPVEPYQQHQTARAERPDGVGDWLLETHGFLKWSGSSTQGGCVHTVLGCSAQWGGGETHFSSLVIDALCGQASRKDITVTWAYCKTSRLEGHSTENVLGGIVKQLVSGREIPVNIRQAFRNNIDGQGPRWLDIKEILMTTIALLPQVYICIDALEYISNALEYRPLVFSFLQDLVRESPSTRLLFTGRLSGGKHLKEYFPDAMTFPISPAGNDIRIHDQTQLPCGEKEPEKVATKSLKRLRIQANLADKHGRTPLLFAAKYGHQDLVKMLLERDVINVEQRHTTLLWAARKGHGEVINILIEHGNIDPNARLGLIPHTVLGLAAECGHVGVVKMLLERRDIKPDLASGRNHRTPLGGAVRGGYETIVKILLERDDVDPNTPDASYRDETPLGWAASEGLVEVVKMLLKRRDIQPDIPNNRGCTPLSLAARRGSEEIVNMLLQRKDVNPDKANNGGKTPLTWAARCGNEEVVKMLLQTGRVNPNRRDSTVVKWGQTPLSHAAQRGWVGVVKMLLEHNDIDPKIADEDGRTPLSYAAAYGRMGVVEVLLEHTDIDPEKVDNHGFTPLLHARSRGYQGIVNLLSKPKAPIPGPVDGQQPT